MREAGISPMTPAEARRRRAYVARGSLLHKAILGLLEVEGGVNEAVDASVREERAAEARRRGKWRIACIGVALIAFAIGVSVGQLLWK